MDVILSLWRLPPWKGEVKSQQNSRVLSRLLRWCTAHIPPGRPHFDTITCHEPIPTVRSPPDVASKALIQSHHVQLPSLSRLLHKTTVVLKATAGDFYAAPSKLTKETLKVSELTILPLHLIQWLALLLGWVQVVLAAKTSAPVGGAHTLYRRFRLAITSWTDLFGLRTHAMHRVGQIFVWPT